MLKVKYLHRKARKNDRDDYWTHNPNKNINLFDDLPFHQRMRNNNYYHDYDLTPLYEFLNSKIGEDWNEVYSEILTKTKKKYRHTIDKMLHQNNCWWYGYIFTSPIYDDEMIPRDSRGRILSNRLFVNYNNIITKKSEDELLIDSKKFLRKKKMLEIIENQSEEDSSSLFL